MSFFSYKAVLLSEKSVTTERGETALLQLVKEPGDCSYAALVFADGREYIDVCGDDETLEQAMSMLADYDAGAFE